MHFPPSIRKTSHALGRALKINPTTVYRVVRTLYNAGYLEQNKQTLSYSLGPEVLKLANIYSYHNPLPLVAQRVFESFTSRFEHNFFLATLSRFEVIYLAVLDGKGPIKVAVTPVFLCRCIPTPWGNYCWRIKMTAMSRSF